MILVKAGKFYLGYYYKNREAKKKTKKVILEIFIICVGQQMGIFS